MPISTILDIVYAIVGAIISAVPFIIALVKICKKKNSAKTDAEKEAAMNDLMEVVTTLIKQAEATYKDVDAILKSENKSAGPVKKDTVLTKLQAYALQKGYDFDIDAWSDKIDDIVAMTKQVNAK